MKALDFGKKPAVSPLQNRTDDASQQLSVAAGVFSRFFRVLKAMRAAVVAAERVEKTQGRPILEPEYAQISHRWAHECLDAARIEVEAAGSPTDQPCIYLGNHVSYVDIALVWSQVGGRFVAKRDIARWPVLGRIFKRAGIVFVERSSSSSRQEVGRTIAREIVENKRSICLFPSGTTAIDEKKPWKWGAFRIAYENKIPVQPFRITYTPLRKVAYIDRDFFPWHLLRLMMQKGMKAKIEFHEPVFIEDPEADCEKWRRWSQGIEIGS